MNSRTTVKIVTLGALVLLPSSCAMVNKCPIERPEPPRADQGARMVVANTASCLASPDGKLAVSGRLEAGAKVVATRAANGHYETWADGKKWCGWVEASSLRPEEASGTRGFPLLLAPLLVAAGKYIVSEITDWVKGKGKEAAEQAVCGAVDVVREEGERVLIKTVDGTKAWAKKQAMIPIAEVKAVTAQGVLGDLMEGGAIPDKASGLMVEARAVRPDGRLIWAGEQLALGDEYDLEVRCSRECYLRITCETPRADALCQYYPSHISGFEESRLLPGGRWVSRELLPAGVHFAVRDPVADKDLIRVEANTYRPFRYVAGGDSGEGCRKVSSVSAGALTGCSRGGGFSGAPECSSTRGGGFSADTLQPQAEAVALLELKTTRTTK